MSDNLVNDVKRLERVGSELSGTNQKLLAAASRVVNLIIQAVPSDLHGSDLGMNYRVVTKWYGQPPNPNLFLVKCQQGWWSSKELKIEIDCSYGHDPLPVAREFASDVAKGLLGQICEKLDHYLTRATYELNALEGGEALLKKNLPQ